MRPALELADIFRRHGDAFRAVQGTRLSPNQRRVMAAIEACRTATLGGHVERCDDCGLVRIAYNSCRDRHCPKCQGLARAQWLADRQADLLPVPYFHIVFTVPAPVAAIALQNKAVVYDILLRAAADTIRLITADARYLGAEPGMIAILHTWGQTLTHHPHAHCLVPGGGFAADGRWIRCRPGFFLPVRVLSRLYRRLFLERLRAAFDDAKLQFFGQLAHLIDPASFGRHLNALRKVEWVVYAKRPFGGPEQVLTYLGRYTHRVAIANSRILACERGRIRFRWKDYRANNKSKVMTLDAEEFIRRFLLHVLPKGFRRIRHFGFLANACRVAKLARIRAALRAPEPPPPAKPVDYRERYAILTGHRLDLCPLCRGRMVGPHGRDWPCAALLNATTCSTTLRHVMMNCLAPSASLHATDMPTVSVGRTNYVQNPSRIPQNLQCALTTLLSRSTLALSACAITVDLASPAPRGPAVVPPSTDSTSFERP